MNYVTFNNELWRIIGVFTVEDENGNQEQRIKIIRNEKLSSDMAWNSNSNNEWATATLNTYLSGEYYDGLDEASKSMISNTKYYLGGSNNALSADACYIWERGNTVSSGHSTSWTGKIALMYPSDNYYVGLSNGWIHASNSTGQQWLLSPQVAHSNFSFNSHSGGVLLMDIVTTKLGIRPVLYLNSFTKIISGDGSQQSPYVLSMN